MTQDNISPVLKNYIPPAALEYCLLLYQNHPFKLKITSNRSSKAGDYKHIPNKDTHHISVNGSLSMYAFLITYVHEVAHLHTFLTYGNSVKPHGWEWKSIFQKLMLPTLHPDLFPNDILKILARHLKNPKASTYSDPELVLVLRTYSKQIDENLKSLISLSPGDNFYFNKREFVRLEKRRTRVLCKDYHTGKKYLISGYVLVQPGKNTYQ